MDKAIDLFLKFSKEIGEIVKKVGWFWRLVRGPRIEAWLVSSRAGHYLVHVRNKGGGSAICRVWLAEIADGNDVSTEEVTTEIEVYWFDSTESMHLSGNKVGRAMVLSVFPIPDERPAYHANIVSSVDGKRKRWAMRLKPLNPMRITVRVAFEWDGYAMDELIRFEVKESDSTETGSVAVMLAPKFPGQPAAKRR